MELATNPNEIKDRLVLAITNNLLLANIPESEDVPEYFQLKHREIIEQVNTKNFNGTNGVQASLHGKHRKTLSKLAIKIATLHREIEDFIQNGEFPS